MADDAGRGGRGHSGDAMTRGPEFFIVGAPKSGTTAMNDYLRQHPEIFMPGPLASFFATDLRFVRRTPTLEGYREIFTGARDGARIGETSVWHLYSRTAAREIKAFCPHARAIVMLRNPVDMLHAQHSEFLHNCNEDIADFEAALDAEDDRRRGMRIPPQAHVREVLLYRETARYTEQVRRYFDVLGRERVHVIVFDDFRASPAAAVESTLRFLDVDATFRPNIAVVNPNKTARVPRLQKLLVAPPERLMRMWDDVAPRALHGRLLPALRRWNTRYTPRAGIAPALRRRLQEEFRTDVEALSRLLDRDLTHWCRD
jgi:hypothetical protein